MLDKIILGTANFTQNYGVLRAKALEQNSINELLEFSLNKGIQTLDSAFAYGDISEVVNDEMLGKFKIITKYSLEEDFKKLIEKLQKLKQIFQVEALLIHDPENLGSTDKLTFGKNLDDLKIKFPELKIGASIYDFEDLSLIDSFFKPEILQVPVNPLNQIFLVPKFYEYCEKNKVEVHGRSLFLQGVLISGKIPEKLSSLSSEIQRLKYASKDYTSLKSAILNWANQQDCISKWVLGVNSKNELQEILEIDLECNSIPVKFEPSNNKLIDPRNW